ncbi:ATP-binding protein [Siphonobacter sp. SORGH_AS_0500]|uniref:AlbA family DNA-binding domain-containing protein n=1 Tax=Siphonobacter sp. SORGH_AS_0500 TaxID=1864824 RepID=UPI00285465F3|nr:ATP-binding protein [Siphonobacter sp. SORGH_AS_0500]MDR6194296.1 putative HTH transcriptional regulator [Siphonobacter sp. SORGH_AS_0500]
MPFPTLTDLLSQSEGSTLEFKRTIEAPGRIAKTLAAFANTSGGWLVIGVNDDRSVKGIESEKDIVQQLEAASDLFVQPGVLLRYKAVEHHERRVLIVRVDESEDKPHQAKDHQGQWQVYVRARDKSVPATKQMGKWLQEQGEVSSELLQQHNVKRLISYLQKHKQISAKQFAQLVNISEYRSDKLLQQCTREGLLLTLHNQQPKTFTLRK